MSNTKPSKQVSPTPKSDVKSLKRRPIHVEKRHSEKRHSEESNEEENEGDSPSKNLDPTAPDEDQIDQKEYTPKKKITVDKPCTQKTNWSSYSKYFVIGFCVCLFFYRYYYHQSQRETKEVDITQIMEDMKYHFKQQSSTTYRFVRSQLRKVVSVYDEPSAPAIITLIANKGAETTASEFSQHLAKALAPEKYVSINDSTYWSNDPDEIRFKIDDEIKSKYHQGELTVVVVDKLNKIPFEAAMIFHGYCDHEHSPYKRAVFLFIVHLNTVIPENAGSKHLDTVAMKSLRNIWHTATDDKVDSLITRLTVAVVNIK